MFGAGFPCSLPLCSPPIMCPYDVPVPQPYPCPFPVPQPCIQNCIQPVDVPIPTTIQPVMIPMPVCVPVPQPVPCPVDRPCPVPVPQPVPCPVDRPCPVPFPVCVPVPQPCVVPQPVLVRQPVCVPVPVPMPMPMPVPVPVQAPQQYQYRVHEEYYMPQYEEDYIDEPIYIKCRRRRRHHHRRRHRSCTPNLAPLPPIIIPFPIQGPPVVEQQAFQVTEYVQDIYPPAQVYTDQVPVGYVARNSVCQQNAQIQNQQSLDCQQGMILPPAPFIQPQQQLLQQLPSGQLIERPLSVGFGGGGGVQTMLSSPQPFLSPSNSTGLMSPCMSGAQLYS